MNNAITRLTMAVRGEIGCIALTAFGAGGSSVDARLGKVDDDLGRHVRV